MVAGVGIDLVGRQGACAGGSPEGCSTCRRERAALKPLNLLKGTAAANSAAAGAAVITVAFAIIQSVAIDQFIAIETARPTLEAALATAQQPVDLRTILSEPNGSDFVLYYWAKAMEVAQEREDRQMVTWAAAAHQRALATGYQPPSAQ